MTERRILFVSYCREDKVWKDRLEPHLRDLCFTHHLDPWVDERQLACGQDLVLEILGAIDRAAIAILLLSTDFLSSDFIRNKELPRILERKDERALQIFPLIVRTCAWKRQDWLSGLVLHPQDGRPVDKWDESELDDVFLKITDDIHDYLTRWSTSSRRGRSASNAGPYRPQPEGAAKSVADSANSHDRFANTNFVLPLDRFIGRGNDLERLSAIFVEQKARLVTILGPAGIGKTRLSQELGARLLPRFAGGCWFADLVEAKTETGIAHEIFKALGSPLASSQADSGESTAEFLKARGPALVILDNFEQVTHHAARTVGYWLQRAPELRFLVTSRDPLRLIGEQPYILNPLSVPLSGPLAEMAQFSSVKLFVDRAQTFDSGFVFDETNREPVLMICAGLEGNPLAIELAAAALRHYDSPHEIADNLSQALTFKAAEQNRQERHDTLETAIAWSYELLKPWEQHAFHQLSVFRDGFFREAADAILELEKFPEAPPKREVLQRLVEQSLLKCATICNKKRYNFYVAIADYTRMMWLQIANKEEKEALERRWAKYYIPYAEGLNRRIRSREGKRALDLLSLELENLFEIQDRFLERHDPETAAQAILALVETMAVRGPAPFRVPRLETSLRALGADGHTELAIRLKTALSAAYWAAGSWNEAEQEADDAVRMARSLDCDAAMAGALHQQGRMRNERGYLRRALDSYQDARKANAKLGRLAGVAIADTDIGATLDRLGELENALEHFDAAEKIALDIGDKVQMAMIYNRRGLALWHHGRLDKALECLQGAEKVSCEVENQAWIAAHRTNQGLVLADLDRVDEALELFRQAASSHRELGYSHWAAVNFGGWGRALMARGEPGDLDLAVERIRKAEKLAREVYYPENIALHVGDLGRIFLAQERYDVSRRMVREAVALERRMGAYRDLRHFNNLVTLAQSCERLGREGETWELIVRACWLVEDIGLTPQQQIRKVTDDLRCLEGLRQRWLKKYGGMAPEDGRRPAAGLRPPTRIAGLELPARRIFELIGITTEMLELPGYEYPWFGLEDELERRGEKTLPLFGYGSLVNRASAERTIRPATPRGFLPTIGFGIVRLLDYDMPAEVRRRSHYTPGPEPLARGLFNARFTGALNDTANGVLVDVSLKDIEPLRQREVGYDLRPITCLPWGDLEAEPISAYALGCSGRLWKGHMLSNSALKPHRMYYDLCRDGAAALSEDFLDYWLRTAFLADGETTALEWDDEKAALQNC